jgi:fibro-slime domain-containing protein
MRTAVALIAASLVAGAPAAAVTVPLTFTLNAQYYTVTTKPTPAGDFQTFCCNDVRTNMVLATLGPNGLPVLNPASTGPQVFKGVDATTSELQWWTPGVTNGGDTVTASGTGTITLPFADNSFFAPSGGGTNNANGFLTARFTGSFTLAAPRYITFNLRADDDAFLFVNNTLFTGIGGVHTATSAPTVRQLFGMGTHTVNLFYADRHRTAAVLQLSGLSEPIPEPASWAMLIAGFGLVGAALRRRAAAAAIA